MSKAVVVGGTGAIGEHVVGQLLTAGTWAKVVTVGRRPVTVPPAYKPDEFKATLEQVTVNMDALEKEGASAFQGANAVFCCLGTTRGTAGSAEGFKKVDYEYVKSAAVAAKAGGAKHFSLVSSQGANASMWANDWGVFHSLLYVRTKGLAEVAVRDQGFESMAVLRPGLLERGSKARGGEKLFSNLLSTVPTSGVAGVMIRAAQAPSRPPIAVYENSAIKAAIKACSAPVPSSITL